MVDIPVDDAFADRVQELIVCEWGWQCANVSTRMMTSLVLRPVL